MSELADHFKRVREALDQVVKRGPLLKVQDIWACQEALESVRAIGEAQHHTSDCAAARWCSKDCDCPRAEIMEVLR